MTDFTGEDLTGSRFEDVHLTGARFHDVDLTDARFHLVDLTGVMIRGAALVNVDISGEIENLRVNGVDVVPLLEAELNRRHPDRVKMRPADADGFREAWDSLICEGPSRNQSWPSPQLCPAVELPHSSQRKT